MLSVAAKSLRLVPLALLTVALAACSSGGDSSSGTASPGAGSAAPAQPASGSTIKIGIDLPVSGADASTGIPTQNGAVLAIDQANAKGLPGGFKLEASLLDDAVQGKHDPAQGAQNMKTFVADPAVLGVVAPFNSNVAKAQIPISNDAGLVQISASATNPGLTKGDDAKKLRSKDTISFFRVCTTDDRQGDAGAQFAKKLGFKRAFIIDDNETYGKGLADVFDARFKAIGGTVLGHEHITPNQQDFKALLTKAKSLNPDVIFYGGTTSTGGGLVRKQMADVGLGTVAYIGGDGISDDEFLKTAGSMADGTYYTVAAPETSKLPTAAGFIKDYKAKYNAEVGAYSANAYTAANVIIAAIEAAIKDNGNKMPTREDVLKHVAATKDFPSPIGMVGFDADGDTTDPILSLYKVAGGKAVFVDQINLK
jgi:branched-chain amino acid transport system substrate-binding protein